MEVFYTALLATFAFCLGACPFSLWTGRWLLHKDIRDYGEGNPGAANVLRAGGRKSFGLALVLDIAKGVPFVVLAYKLFSLPEPAVLVVALGAVLGSALSPLLRFKGGKSVAVTFGVLMALPQHQMLLAMAAFLLLGYLLIKSNAWAVILGTATSLAYLVATGTGLWPSLFILCVLVVFVVRNANELQAAPRVKVKPAYWFQTRRHI